MGLRGIPHEILYDGHAIWITNGFDGTLSRVTPGEIASPPFRPEPKSAGRLTLAFGAGSLWVGSRDNVITRLTPLGRELALIHGIRTPQALAVGFHSVWVAQATSVDLLRIDARTNRIVKSIPLGGIPSAVAVTRNALWALAPTEGQLWRIDPHTDAVTATIDVGPDTSALVAAGNGIWVAAGSLGTLIRIDPGTNKATATIELHHPIAGIASTGDQLLVTIQ
jgi:DNA-binding beta-propeller fold protein YncE